MFEPEEFELTKDDLYKVYAAKWVAAYNMSGEIGPKMECYIKVILQRKQNKYTCTCTLPYRGPAYTM